MATIAEPEAGRAKKPPLPPPSTPMAFVGDLPPEIISTSVPFGESKWVGIMRELIEKYEMGEVPVVPNGDGTSSYAWCNVQQYSKKHGARDALKRLEEDAHPWTVTLKVKAKFFQFVARQLPQGGSAIFVRAILNATPNNEEASNEEGDD